MASAVVVPVEPPGQVLGKLGTDFIGLQVNSLVFQGTPESFDEDVIQTPPPSIHTDGYLVRLQYTRKLRTREVTALITVEDLRCSL